MKPQKFAAFDIDGTIFRWQLYHELVFDLAENGDLPQDFLKDIIPYLENWRSRSGKSAFSDYELKLVEAFVIHLKGLRVAAVKRSAATVMARSGDHVYFYTRDLLRSLKRQGYALIALSGSFEQVVEPFARKYHFDYWVGTHCESRGGIFTGEAVWNYNQKDKNLKELIPKYNLSLEGSIAVGDTASDVPMLEMVERPIAFNPNQELFDIATKRGWDVVVERKNVIYKLAPGKTGYELQNKRK
ncbi:MAG TPA: HAD family phosphatase [Candidatus Saccharimonadia bacterium]|nr:HAD family phosphatase [Candidatus Saccharimonadia bacterium]